MSPTTGCIVCGNPIRAPRSRCRRHAIRRTLTAKRKAAIKRRDGYRCQRCGAAPPILHVDHKIPLSKGGTDTDDNLETLCGPCNLRKGAR